MDINRVSEILKAWGVEFAGMDSDCNVEGSPERSASRRVVVDPEGCRWILEQIEEGNLARKRQVAEQIETLDKSGLGGIHPWQRTKSSSFFQCLENNEGAGSVCWMLRPFVEGVPLDRTTYLDDTWRVDAMAEFLIELRRTTATHPGLPPSPSSGAAGRPPLQRRGTVEIPSIGGVRDLSAVALAKEEAGVLATRMLTQRQVEIPSIGGVREAGGGFFSITAYAENRMADWRKRDSKLAEKLEPSFCKLQKNFFPVHDRLLVSFCHGDYHPLNMVWGEGAIHSVIDWEFCGRKPELYDVALLLGCIGFDEPDNLIKEPAIRLVENLRGAGFGKPESWDHLLDLMAAIRFGWMSEWIRRSDREARRMEAVYIDILVDQKEYILQHW